MDALDPIERIHYNGDKQMDREGGEGKRAIPLSFNKGEPMKRKYKFALSITVILEFLAIVLLVGLLIWQQRSIPDNMVTDEELEILHMLSREEKLLMNDSVPFESLSEIECSLEPLVPWHYQEQYYNKELVWWEEFAGQDGIQELEERLSISVPDMDMEKYSIIASAGRKIESLRAVSPNGEIDPFGSDHLPTACVTFSKEFYKDKVFFYTVEHPGQGQSVFFPAWIHSIYFVASEHFIGTSAGLCDTGE